MGGGHYIYIMGHRDLFLRAASTSLIANVDASTGYICNYYDEGDWIMKHFARIEAATSSSTKVTLKHYLYKNVLWTTIPLSNNYTWLEEGNDVTMTVCVSRPYQKWSSTSGASVSNPRNENLPLYRFSTKELAAIHGQRQVANSYMDSIYITPNPYYGMSRGYEISQLDTRVKLVNLPPTCKIKIFSMDGTLIRSFDKPNDGTTYLEWDLKNAANIPIASGMYLIHIRDNTYKTEKTLKFLCIQRPVDVNAF
jgi:hypothetical protein